MDLTCALTLTQGEDKIGLFQVLTVSGVSLMFRRIPAGAFLMGSPTDEPSRFADEEQREESVAAFWMADTPVTQALYRAVSGECPSHSQGGDLPVEMVSWEDALAFIDKLGRLVPGLNLRLPSEVEWEYACRAGATSAYSFGTTVSPSQANFRSGRDGRRGVAEVKAYRANAWGLHQMHGNVWEWCLGRGARCRMLRGGSWSCALSSLRSAAHGHSPFSRDYNIGFRVAMTHPA